jgi:hypothetical protein
MDAILLGPTLKPFDRLVVRLVWCSYMMHVYDGFNAYEVPR